MRETLGREDWPRERHALTNRAPAVPLTGNDDTWRNINGQDRCVSERALSALNALGRDHRTRIQTPGKKLAFRVLSPYHRDPPLYDLHPSPLVYYQRVQ